MVDGSAYRFRHCGEQSFRRAAEAAFNLVSRPGPEGSRSTIETRWIDMFIHQLDATGGYSRAEAIEVIDNEDTRSRSAW
jgi:hypothetical protein